ncbi:unnamed protein product [Trifolium pratense]|uniref:Uncharacterized protein n=1 Tax=Trifolium pratense TaxID=57577 RepID=A0ACB0L252_TRIPR|nr:unnamed protein product [Trifolium pratense]
MACIGICMVLLLYAGCNLELIRVGFGISFAEMMEDMLKTRSIEWSLFCEGLPHVLAWSLGLYVLAI